MKLWPLPALVAWGASWGLYLLLLQVDAPAWVALGLAAMLGGVFTVFASTPWRRIFVVAGFPLSLLASGLAGAVPAWAWLLPLAALLLLYPLNAWRDAPLFPTPVGALRGLGETVMLPGTSPRIVDAGCGMGDALRELQSEYPSAKLEGLEYSWPLRFACALRCRLIGVKARIQRADIWKADWSPYAMVYLFQRPESMARAVRKAERELRCGAWMASLEFEAEGLRPTARHVCEDGRTVWLYQAPFKQG
jgi:hypothetical protein